MVGRGVDQNDIKAIRDLQIISALRGVDSTGYAVGLSTSEKYHDLIKYSGDPISFNWTTSNQEDYVIDSIHNDYWIGHTRSGTRGTRSSNGAQPFRIKHITGVHNGTIEGDIRGYYSDSELLLSSIAMNGPKPTLSALTEKDSAALIWFDREKKRLFFYRNQLRPLTFAVHKKKDVIYWASEQLALDLALTRNHIRDVDYWYFTPYVLYSCDPSRVRKDEKFAFGRQEIKPKWLLEKEAKKAEEDKLKELQTKTIQVEANQLEQQSLPFSMSPDV